MLPLFSGLKAMIGSEAHFAKGRRWRFTWKLPKYSYLKAPCENLHKLLKLRSWWNASMLFRKLRLQRARWADLPPSSPREMIAKLGSILSQDFGVSSREFHDMSCCPSFVFDGGDWLHKTDTCILHEIIALTSGPRVCKHNHLGPPHEDLNKSVKEPVLVKPRNGWRHTVTALWFHSWLFLEKQEPWERLSTVGV